MAEERPVDTKAPVELTGQDGREIVLPLLTEELSVSKRVVPKGRVQVSRVTRQREEVVDELLVTCPRYSYQP